MKNIKKYIYKDSIILITLKVPKIIKVGKHKQRQLLFIYAERNNMSDESKIDEKFVASCQPVGIFNYFFKTTSSRLLRFCRLDKFCYISSN